MPTSYEETYSVDSLLAQIIIKGINHQIVNKGLVYNYQTLVDTKVKVNSFIKGIHTINKEGTDGQDNTSFSTTKYFAFFHHRVRISDASGLLVTAENKGIYYMEDWQLGYDWAMLSVSVTGIKNLCTEYELLCDSENYPGWECVPIEPIANQLNSIRNEQQREPRL